MLLHTTFTSRSASHLTRQRYGYRPFVHGDDVEGLDLFWQGYFRWRMAAVNPSRSPP